MATVPVRRRGEAPRPRPDTREIAAVQITDRYSTYPSNGLTPAKLAQIFREADDGDSYRQAELFEEMEEKDPHLFSQLQTRKNAVTGLDYEVIPASDDAVAKETAEFIKAELNALENIEGIMTDLLDAIGKGISISEILWRVNPAGDAHIQDIIWRHPKRVHWDTDDNLKITTQEAPQGLLIPQNKFIIHRYKARSGHPARAGILRVVAWMYLFKNYDVKDWVSFCEVYGMPLRIGTYNPSAPEKDRQALMRALIQIGTDAAGVIPEGTRIDFQEAAKISSINLYESLARYCDEQVSKAILGQTLTSDSGGGSYAQSKTHDKVRGDLTVADCKALAATLRRDVFHPLVVFNFGRGAPVPYLRFDCEEAEDLKETMEIYKGLSSMGLDISAEHVYKKFSIPSPEEGEKIISRPAAGFPSYLKALALKSAPPDPHQREIDRLADKALIEGGGIFRELAAPLMEVLDQADSLEELEQLFQDEEAVNRLANQMAGDELEDLLHKTMFLADLKGRGLEYV